MFPIAVNLIPLLEKDTGVDFRKSMSVFLFAVDKAYFYAQNQIFG